MSDLNMNFLNFLQSAGVDLKSLVKETIKETMGEQLNQSQASAEVEGFVEYVIRVAVSKAAIAKAADIHIQTLENRLKNPQDFSIREIESIAVHLNFSKEYLQRMIEVSIKNKKAAADKAAAK